MNIAELVRSRRELILQIAARYGARNVRIFGSVVRGQARADSDVDLLVALGPGRSLLDQIGLEQELQTALGCRVEVVVEGGISPYLEAQIQAEAKPL